MNGVALKVRPTSKQKGGRSVSQLHSTPVTPSVLPMLPIQRQVMQNQQVISDLMQGKEKEQDQRQDYQEAVLRKRLKKLEQDQQYMQKALFKAALQTLSQPPQPKLSPRSDQSGSQLGLNFKKGGNPFQNALTKGVREKQAQIQFYDNFLQQLPEQKQVTSPNDAILARLRRDEGEKLLEEVNKRFGDQLPSLEPEKDRHFLDTIP